VLLTDTTMRDGHQSLLATRMRSFDIVRGSPDAYAAQLPQLFSLECWGGATFDVAMRFLTGRAHGSGCAKLRREQARTSCCRCCCAAANGVGYTNYPDNVVRHFVACRRRTGVDLFRVFDCLNWVENMRVSMDAVLRRQDSAKRRSATPATSWTRPRRNTT
jgi:pyruvate carboxylase